MERTTDEFVKEESVKNCSGETEDANNTVDEEAMCQSIDDLFEYLVKTGDIDLGDLTPEDYAPAEKISGEEFEKMKKEMFGEDNQSEQTDR